MTRSPAVFFRIEHGLILLCFPYENEPKNVSTAHIVSNTQLVVYLLHFLRLVVAIGDILFFYHKDCSSSPNFELSICNSFLYIDYIGYIFHGLEVFKFCVPYTKCDYVPVITDYNGNSLFPYC